MVSIKDSAEAYEPPQIKNIAELEKVSIDADIKKEIFKKGTSDEFTINYIEIQDEKYRIPNSVLGALKVLMEEKPDMKLFKVVKSGTGMSTSYQVIDVNK